MSPTAAVEVTNISQHGLWILVDGEEYFLPFETFPWFKDAPIGKLLHVTLHDGDRAWKGFDFEVMERRCEKGYILDPRGKSKSVVLTGEGVARSRELFEELFGKKGKLTAEIQEEKQ